MNKTNQYEKVFSRDFALTWLEIWYEGEAKMPKPWNNQRNASAPYLVFVRNDDTVTSYYDPEGLQWSRSSVLNEIKNNPQFTQTLIDNVLKELETVNKFLTSPASKKSELLAFFEFFKKAYPWFLGMWEVTEAEENEVGNIDISAIQKLKESSGNSLSDDLDNIIRESLIKIFPRVANYAHVLSIDEIMSEQFPHFSILQTRDKGFIYTDGRLFDSDDLSTLEHKYSMCIPQTVQRKNVSIITGSTASMGAAKGIVRRVMGYKNIAEFKEGEILVSPMTMPDFVPAIKKAAAIVTDEGGVTCHAAILAREFGKPCIVGTQVATSTLKNGDLVEVDATRGIVKKLSQSIRSY